METDKPDYINIAYRENSSLATYVRLRRSYPNHRIDFYEGFSVDGLEWVSGREEFDKFDIPAETAYAAVTGECAAISELCLCVMELLVEREHLCKTRKTHAVSRGEVISDVFVNTLISYILAGLAFSRHFHVNPDLVKLISHQLADGATRLKNKRSKVLDRSEIMDVACDLQRKGIEPSYRAIAKVMGVAPTTVMRSFRSDLLDLIKAGRIRPTVDKSPEARRNWLLGLRIATQLADRNEKISPTIICEARGLPKYSMSDDVPEGKLLNMVEEGLLRLGVRESSYAQENP
jgi:hypothetical protein